MVLISKLEKEHIFENETIDSWMCMRKIKWSDGWK